MLEMCEKDNRVEMPNTTSGRNTSATMAGRYDWYETTESKTLEYKSIHRSKSQAMPKLAIDSSVSVTTVPPPVARYLRQLIE